MAALLGKHWPHLIFVAIGVVAFLWTAYRPERSTERVPRSVPTPPEELRQRPTAPAAVRRSVARRGLHALGPLLGALATGAILYGINVGGGAVPGALIWAHSGISVLALLLVAYKVNDVGIARMRRALARERLRELISIVLGALSVPLLVSGTALLLTPSTRSFAAYSHLISSVWWTGLLLWHLGRYLRGSLQAVGLGVLGADPGSCPEVVGLSDAAGGWPQRCEQVVCDVDSDVHLLKFGNGDRPSQPPDPLDDHLEVLRADLRDHGLEDRRLHEKLNPDGVILDLDSLDRPVVYLDGHADSHVHQRGLAAVELLDP